MVKILHKIADPQKDISHLNHNFDEIAIGLANASGQFSSVGTTNISISDGQSAAVQVNIDDVYNVYTINKLPVITRCDIFVDFDNNADYRYPTGVNITAAQVHGIGIDILQSLTATITDTYEKATVFITLHNRTGAVHTFYFHIDVFYLPTPTLGVAKRASA